MLCCLAVLGTRQPWDATWIFLASVISLVRCLEALISSRAEFGDGPDVATLIETVIAKT